MEKSAHVCIYLSLAASLQMSGILHTLIGTAMYCLLACLSGCQGSHSTIALPKESWDHKFGD